jgi:malate dehydrogenase (oxaloacetate-decarboxylating)
MAIAPSASYSLAVRLEIKNRPGMLGRVPSAIGAAGGDIGAVDLVESQRDRVIRDITIKARDSVHGQQIVNQLRRLLGARVANVSDRTFSLHLGGKIDSRARTVNDEMKLAAARALAGAVARSELSAEYIIPSVFNKAVAPAVAEGVARAAHQTGVARRRRREAIPLW